jgi:hypothetical protein
VPITVFTGGDLSSPGDMGPARLSQPVYCRDVKNGGHLAAWEFSL